MLNFPKYIKKRIKIVLLIQIASSFCVSLSECFAKATLLSIIDERIVNTLLFSFGGFISYKRTFKFVLLAPKVNLLLRLHNSMCFYSLCLFCFLRINKLRN